jgi:spore coat protein A, manganese oxidase
MQTRTTRSTCTSPTSGSYPETGGPPAPYDVGLKDTVLMRAGDDVRIAARFDGYRGKYVFHCHNLEHEDMMMMANFEVV